MIDSSSREEIEECDCTQGSKSCSPALGIHLCLHAPRAALADEEVELCKTTKLP